VCFIIPDHFGGGGKNVFFYQHFFLKRETCRVVFIEKLDR
jgi:hypothetical protein